MNAVKRKQHFGVCWAIAAVLLTSCFDQKIQQRQQSSSEGKGSLKAVTVDRTKVVMGQTVYVPIYSHIYHYNSQNHVMNLSATLSIRNTDLTNSIIITSVRYYNTNGQLVRQEITNPVELKSLASTDFFIATDDSSGGSGANFIVEWLAQNQVYEPVIEAIMISSPSQGISFISPGRVLNQHGMPD